MYRLSYATYIYTYEDVIALEETTKQKQLFNSNNFHRGHIKDFRIKMKINHLKDYRTSLENVGLLHLINPPAVVLKLVMMGRPVLVVLYPADVFVDTVVTKPVRKKTHFKKKQSESDSHLIPIRVAGLMMACISNAEDVNVFLYL